MEMKLISGDYVPAKNGGLETVTGTQKLLQRVLFKLSARRGGFIHMPELGSRLYLLGREKSANRESAARQYVTEALAGEAGLSVKEVSISQEDGRTYLTVHLEYGGEDLTLEMQAIL